MNNQNLININDRTPEEQLAIRQAGGRAAAKARKSKNALRDRLENLLEQRVKGPTQADSDDPFDLAMDHKLPQRIYAMDVDGTFYDELCANILDKALRGDKYAINTIRVLLENSGE